MDFQYKRKLSHLQSKMMVYQHFCCCSYLQWCCNYFFLYIYTIYAYLHDFRIPVTLCGRSYIKNWSQNWYDVLASLFTTIFIYLRCLYVTVKCLNPCKLTAYDASYTHDMSVSCDVYTCLVVHVTIFRVPLTYAPTPTPL